MIMTMKKRKIRFEKYMMNMEVGLRTNMIFYGYLAQNSSGDLESTLK